MQLFGKIILVGRALLSLQSERRHEDTGEPREGGKVCNSGEHTRPGCGVRRPRRAQSSANARFHMQRRRPRQPESSTVRTPSLQEPGTLHASVGAEALAKVT
jgi:hypothetical protein